MNRKRIAWLVAAVALLGLLALLLRSKPTREASATDEGQAASDRASGTTGRGAPPDLEGAIPAQLPPPDLPRVSLRGRVVASDWTSVAGAEVAILRYPAGERVPGMLQRVRESGADGTFEFKGLMVGEYLLEARKGSQVSASLPFELTETSEPATLMLVRGAVLRVEVRNLVTDKPIPGALARVALGDREFGGADAYVEKEADASGVATFEGVASTAMHAVYAEADGFLAAMENLLPGANPDPGTWQAVIHLDPDVATVTGRVIDTRGAPVPGAKVGWGLGDSEIDSGLFDLLPMPRLEGAAISADDGTFALQVKPGRGCVVAMPTGRRLGQTCGVEVRPAAVAENIEVVVEDGVRVAGVVRREGQPVAGATVLMTMAQWNHMPMFANTYRFRTSSDRNGRYEFSGVDPHELIVYAMDEESSSELVPVDLRAGRDVSGIDVDLVHTGTITGRVTSTDGEGVPFAKIWYFASPDESESVIEEGKEVVYPEVFTKAASTAHTLTDQQGNFVLGGLPPSRYVIKAGRAGGSSVPPSYARTEKQDVEIGEHVELVLRDVSAVTGTVAYKDGKPATSFRISIAYYTAHYTEDSFAPPHEFDSEDGSFRIPEVPDGRYGLEITGPEIVPLRLEGPIAVKGSTDLGTLEVERGIEREGVVTHTSGEPAPHTKVLISTSGGPTQYKTVQTGPGGTFRVPAIRAGETIRLRAEQGQLTADWQTFPADGPVELVLRAGSRGSIFGLIVDDHPAEGRMVALTQPGAGEPGMGLPIVEMVSAAEAGKFEILDVPAGTYTLWVRRHDADQGGGWWVYPEPVKIEAKIDSQLVANLTGPGNPEGGSDDPGRGGGDDRPAPEPPR